MPSECSNKCVPDITHPGYVIKHRSQWDITTLKILIFYMLNRPAQVQIKKMPSSNYIMNVYISSFNMNIFL